MNVNESKSLLHWNYFLALESDVERLARFVEFAGNNFDTYSIEIAHLFLAAASEVDVVTKQLCLLVDTAANPKNIEQYRAVLRRCLPEIENSLITIPRYGLDFRPWGSWENGETPDWWSAHNKVKHQRGEHFALANLKNVLNAMAGLFVVVLYYYRHVIDDRRIEPPPNLFTPPADLAMVCPTLGGPMALYFTEDER
ncbi:hypothetical protein [Candidatus Thiodictyon syntrophicum]|jgi:hypothetical protein|uniref:HEPN AbiU2-like domain-containing protein n=1 Tax=Candidatus Thiodictyon syntrophicum TaxID=1166950 RepID=A0A2K8UA42_9GAMM|nr:hypothetical protein [Candidatus Thiodictyon syntrophicum]AUB82442.1 hypothetical protein THSYN_16825 [Candidatus Thiodictyon syntrophicum]